MRTDYDWLNPFLMEQKIAHIISQQSKHGTNFKERDAKWNVHVLTEKIVNIDKELIPLLPPMINVGTEYKAPFKLNGQPKVFVQKYLDMHGMSPDLIGGPFTACYWTPFDPSKSAKIKAVLIDLGWIPTEWNNKKMPFRVYSYRKKLWKMTYSAFIKQCSKEERDLYTGLVDGYVDEHFRGKTVNYMKSRLIGMGFDLEKTPSFDDIRKKLLLSQFWISSPKITEDSFESISDSDGHLLSLLKSRMQISHRQSLIQGLIEKVRDDGKLEGQANPCATPTARMKHRIIVNIPSSGSFFGSECRDLFIGDSEPKGRGPKVIHKLTAAMIESGKFRKRPNTNIMEEFDKGEWVEHGYVSCLIPDGQQAFVGGDGAGLELRMLAHYLVSVCKMLLQEATDSGNQQAMTFYDKALTSALEYREVLLTGDIHTHNQRLAGLKKRSQAKTFIYAFLYGAGNANLGAQLGGDTALGEAARDTFLKECPCIPVLIDWTQSFAKKHGWLPGLDGRKLIMRRDADSGEVMAHKALNTLLQAAGSIVMKYAGCFLFTWIKDENLNCHQVIMMHKRIHCAFKIM